MNPLPEEICIQFMSYADIPFRADIYAQDLNIDWGDGVISSFRNNSYFNLKHEYESEGLYTVRISGVYITGLNISRLSLTELSLLHCPSLEYLNCAVNELEKLDLSACPALEEIMCNSNNLKQISFSSNPRLTQVNVSYNLLSTLDISECACLQSLCCSYNRLSVLRTHGCRLLNTLDCSSNLLDKKQLEKIFTDLPMKVYKATICYTENPGTESADNRLLHDKNWH